MRSFDQLVEYALAEQVDLVLFAGDAYKSRDPNPTHQREFARRVHRLAAAQIPVFLLVGNHDIPNTLGRANTLDIFATLEVENVTVARTPKTYRISTHSGPLQVIAVPWIVRSQMLSREEYRNRTLAEIEEQLLQLVDEFLTKQVAGLDPAVPTIVAMHGNVQGAKYGSERSVMLGQELVLPPGLLKNKAFDYIALGHIHRHQVLNQEPPIVYSGSVDRVDFGEEKEAKGFVVAEVERGRTHFQFVELPGTRRFVTIEVWADGPNPMVEVQRAVAAHDIREAIVRMIIHTTVEKNQLLRDNEIHNLLGEAYKVATIVRDVKRVSRLRLGSDMAIEQMTPLQLLERYLSVSKGQRSKERTKKLLEYARRIMNIEA
jgi:exonuclease SbcD